MLIILMYHRIHNAHRKATLHDFEQHLKKLSASYSIVLPGENVPTDTKSVCLSFDDAYYDFYHYIFPLLKKYKARALLAIPVKYIVENTPLDAETRLNFPYHEIMQGDNYQKYAPLCTWQELREMASSDYVTMASHAYSHQRITNNGADLARELGYSQEILQQQLQRPIDSFVYPYGAMNRACHQQVRRYYRYGLRIGSALNKNWDDPLGLFYRIDAEHYWPQQKIPSRLDIGKFQLNFWANRLRGK